MAKSRSGKSVVGVVDRLEAIYRTEGAYLDPETLSENYIRDSVRRNLIDLLNSRIHFFQAFNDATLQSSVVNYGIPDFLGVSCSTETGQREFRLQVQKCIERYEPRLSGVAVQLLSHNRLTERNVFLRITGDLELENGIEKIVFQSAVELKTNTIQVEQQ